MKNWPTNTYLFIDIYADTYPYRKTQRQVKYFSIFTIQWAKGLFSRRFGWMDAREIRTSGLLFCAPEHVDSKSAPSSVLWGRLAHWAGPQNCTHTHTHARMCIVPLGYKRFAHINTSLFTLLCQLAIRAMNFITAKWSVSRSCCSMEWTYKRQSTHTGMHQ